VTSDSSCCRKLFWGILICSATFYSIFTIVDHFEVSQQSLRWNQQRLLNFSATTKNRRACSQKLSFSQNFKWCKSGRVSTPSIRSGNFRNTFRTIQNSVKKLLVLLIIFLENYISTFYGNYFDSPNDFNVTMFNGLDLGEFFLSTRPEVVILRCQVNA